MEAVERILRWPEWTITRSSAALLFFNLLDGLFTLLFLQLGVAEEANPLMRWAYEGSPLWFMVTKLTAVHFGVMLLALHRHSNAARHALRAGAALYAAIVAYHLFFMARIALS